MKREPVLALVPKLGIASSTSIFRGGSRWKREPAVKTDPMFTVIAKLDLVALYLEAACPTRKGSR